MARERVNPTASSSRDVSGIPLGDLEKGLRIDEHALDEALQHQPDLFYRVSKQLALLISQRDYAKQELQEIEARVGIDIRRGAELEKTKITVAEVDAEKTMDKEVQAANRRLLDLQAQVGELSALKEAFTQRSYALKDLCALHIANYYGDSSQSMSERREARNADNRKNLNEERRKRV